MSINDLDPNDLQDWNRPCARAKAEAVCLGRALMPHPSTETFTRTAVTLLFLGTWITGILGPAFNAADPLPQEIMLPFTAIVFLLVGHLWGLEVDKVLSGITITTDGGPNIAETPDEDPRKDGDRE